VALRGAVSGRSSDGRDEWHNRIVREHSGGAVVGFVQATIVDLPGGVGRSAEVAWLIGVPWQGRGFATEAASGLLARLESLAVGEIVAHVHPDHRASALVAERIGLQPTDELVDGERVWRRTVSEAARSD
jgi:RimJ/RimL family protein N-acetyltransferase